MPMYEKGSVRAEPRSKQQERMKKIMKKFLSSLLALTMIFSLVVVPARAADELTVTGLSMEAKVNGSDIPEKGIAAGTSVTFTIKGDASVKEGSTVVSDATASYKWDTNSTATTEKTYTKTITGEPGTSVTVNCDVIYTTGEEGSQKTGKQTVSATVKIISEQDAFEAAAKNATVSFQGRTYSFKNSTSVQIDTFNSESLGDSLSVTVSSAYPSAVLKKAASGQWTIKNSNDGTLSLDVTVTANPISSDVAAAALSFDKDSTISIREGQSVDVTATYNREGKQNVSYKWTRTPTSAGLDNSSSSKVTFNAPDQVASAGETYTLTCTVQEGASVVTHKDITVKVARDPYSPDRNGESSSKTIATNNSATCEIQAPVLKSSNDIIPYRSNNTDNFDIAWVVTRGSSLVSVAKRTADGYGIVTAKSGAKSGTATVTATITYMGKEYPALEYTIDISALDVDLGSITNGDSDEYSQSSLESKLATAINKVTSSTFTSNSISHVYVTGIPSRVTLKDGSASMTAGKEVTSGLDVYADKGFIGDGSFQLRVTDTDNHNYTVILYVSIEGDKDIKDTVTGTSANKSVTFTNSDYDYLYVYQGSATFKTEMYDGDWSTSLGHTNWKPVKKNADYTVSSSAFSSGKATLYVVAVDDGIASTGTITVSQKSYDINYNVAAGKSVTFNQKDFEDFLADIAEDDGKYNPKKDDISFDHAVLTSSVPSTKNEGTLYYGSTEITSSNRSKTEMTDMDKVSFDTVSKPSKDTITLTFKVYGEVEKPNSRKADKVDYSVNVVISVVKEDITYTVGIDDTVQLTARDFVNFLQDARTSYRKAELDYVKFDVSGKNVSSYAYGGLYRSYSSYSTGKLADSTDKFYYEPSRTQYDLADVAYHTTRWAEAGKTVYIPFTVYGTKGEEASGTMAITIAQTMNFIDVKASDFFYEPVKWAVNNKITNGTSSTTFSPYKNCNRAEIVTFLWRAAGSPEPTSTRNPFTDVNSVRDASYYKAILWASQKGITAGTNATTFSPYQECTRSQIVTFLYRYAGKPSGYYTNPFKDVSSVNEASYYNAILWAVGRGITQGTSTTTFSPYASCTRGEAVTFLYRYVNGVK